MEQDIAIPKILPPPIGGWNARDPLHAMADSDAIELVNFFPDSQQIKVRGGTTLFYNGSGLTCIMPIPRTTTTAAYIIGVDSSKIWRIQVSNANATDITNAVAVGGTAYRGVMFQGRLFCVNGSNAPFDVGVSGNANATGWSGTGLTITNLMTATAYKGRLYFSEKGTSNIWYGGLEYITGELTKFDCSSGMTRGGNVVAVGVTTKQGGSNAKLLVIVTSEGEVLVYGGSYPNSPDWSILGSFFISKPVGYDCIFYKGSDLHIFTKAGIVSIGALLNNDKDENGQVRVVSDKISNAFRDATASVFFSNVCGAAHLPSQKSLIVYGFGYNDTSECQFVQNAETGAWCKYTGFGGWGFCEVDDRVFALLNSTTVGISLKVYELAKPGTSGNLDEAQPTALHTYSAPGTPIQCTCRQAFNFLDDPTVNKHITEAKLFFELTQESGHSQTVREIKAGADTDFASADTLNDVPLQAIATDGTVNYKLVTDVFAEGTAFSLLFKARFGGGYILKWFLSMLKYESGGFE